MKSLSQLACLLVVACSCGDIEFVRYVGFDAGDADDVDAADDTGAPAQLPSSCDELAAAFPLCGGDPVGAWEISLWCPVGDAFDPFDGLCEGVTSEGTGEATGTLQVDADGSWTLRWDRRVLAASFSFDLACFGGTTTPCDGANFVGECEVSWPRCECDISQTVEAFVERGTWTAGDSAMSVLVGDALYDHVYCVDDARDAMWLFRLANDVDLAWRMLLRRPAPVN